MAVTHPFFGRRVRPLPPPLRLWVAPLALVHGGDGGRGGVPFLVFVLRLRDQRGRGGLQARSLAGTAGTGFSTSRASNPSASSVPYGKYAPDARTPTQAADDPAPV